MLILVTGGAGYIGSIVAGQLLEAGHQVVVYDNLRRGHRAAVPAGAEFVSGDVGDRAALDRLFGRRRFDSVMHFAALIEAGESMEIPETYFRNNTANTLNLLESMLAHGVDRLVFSSTAAVYGNPARLPIREGDDLLPTNPYGESKLLVERMLGWLAERRGLRYASLRYFNAAGATAERGEAHNPESHLIPRMLRVAMGRAGSVQIFGDDYPTPDGTCVRDYIHVSDIASAHLLALEGLAARPRLVYNLGNGRGFSVLQVLQAVREVTGRTVPEVRMPRRPGDPAELVADSETIRRELGWRPKYPELQQIIASAWNWHCRYPDGYPAAL